MREFWLPVPGFEGLYAVSDAGRVKSLARTVERGGHLLPVKGRVLKPSPTAQGYPLVVLSREGKTTPRTVHSLVMSAFVPKPTPQHEVDHRDRVRDNNALSNLRWATRSQNNGNAEHGRGASRYRGVVLGQNGRWAAQIGVGRKHKFLGEFSAEDEAAKAFDRASLDYFGEFARLNFPHETQGVAP